MRKGKLCYVEANVIEVNREIIKLNTKISAIFQDKNGRTHFFTVSIYNTYVTRSGMGGLYEGDTGILAYKQDDRGHTEYVDFFLNMTQEQFDMLSGKRTTVEKVYEMNMNKDIEIISKYPIISLIMICILAGIMKIGGPLLLITPIFFATQFTIVCAVIFFIVIIIWIIVKKRNNR